MFKVNNKVTRTTPLKSFYENHISVIDFAWAFSRIAKTVISEKTSSSFSFVRNEKLEDQIHGDCQILSMSVEII